MIKGARHLPLTKEESNLFSQFVSSRYKKRSTIYTPNKSFSEWGEILGDSVMASTVLDMILHHFYEKSSMTFT